MLANKAILVNLRMGKWAGKRIDHKATDTVENAHNTKGNVGNYTKFLLPGAKELKKIESLESAMRRFVEDSTLPWCADGTRILSSKLYLDFTNSYRAKYDAWESAVNEFLAAYPALREHARVTLGDLFLDSEYPDVNYLKTRFYCDLAFYPMPTVQDFRVELLDSEKQAFIERMQETEVKATQECWQRLFDVVSKAAAKLNQPDAIFRDTLIENITDLCKILPKLNPLDDANLEAMRQQVENTVNSLSPDQLRESKIDRDAAAKQLEEITSKMSAFMGAL